MLRLRNGFALNLCWVCTLSGVRRILNLYQLSIIPSLYYAQIQFTNFPKAAFITNDIDT
jgi:hypothetical protein